MKKILNLLIMFLASISFAMEEQKTSLPTSYQCKDYFEDPLEISFRKKLKAVYCQEECLGAEDAKITDVIKLIYKLYQLSEMGLLTVEKLNEVTDQLREIDRGFTAVHNRPWGELITLDVSKKYNKIYYIGGIRPGTYTQDGLEGTCTSIHHHNFKLERIIPLSGEIHALDLFKADSFEDTKHEALYRFLNGNSYEVSPGFVMGMANFSNKMAMWIEIAEGTNLDPNTLEKDTYRHIKTIDIVTTKKGSDSKYPNQYTYKLVFSPKDLTPLPELVEDKKELSQHKQAFTMVEEQLQAINIRRINFINYWKGMCQTPIPAENTEEKQELCKILTKSLVTARLEFAEIQKEILDLTTKREELFQELKDRGYRDDNV